MSNEPESLDNGDAGEVHTVEITVELRVPRHLTTAEIVAFALRRHARRIEDGLTLEGIETIGDVTYHKEALVPVKVGWRHLLPADDGKALLVA